MLPEPAWLASALLALLPAQAAEQGTAPRAGAASERPEVVVREGRTVAAELAPFLHEGARTEQAAAEFEALVPRLLRLPPGFRFSSTRRRAPDENRPPLAFRPNGDAWLLLGRLSHDDFTGLELRCGISLDLEWVALGGVAFHADEPRSRHLRSERDRGVHYRLAELPAVLRALHAALLPIAERGVLWGRLELDVGDSFGPAPYLHVAASVALDAPALVPLRIRGKLALPPSAAQPEEPLERRTRRVGYAEPASGEVAQRTLLQSHDALLDCERVLGTLPGKARRLTHEPGRDRATFRLLVPTSGGREAELHLELTPSRLDTAAAVHWGAFPTSVDQTRAVLTSAVQLASELDEQLALAAVFPPADAATSTCTIVIATTPATAHTMRATHAHLLEIEVPLGGTPITSREFWVADVVRSGEFDVVWRAHLASSLDAFTVTREYRDCGVGRTWPPRATYEDRSGALVGGTSFTEPPLPQARR